MKNRDLGTIERIEGSSGTVRMDGDKPRSLTFDALDMQHFDHGYAVTSHSSQGLTTDRVLINMDTAAHPELINTRFAYVSVSRASQDARIYTNDASTLAERLSSNIGKTSAVQPELRTEKPEIKEESMRHTQDNRLDGIAEQTRREAPATTNARMEVAPSAEDRHYAPLRNALPTEAPNYEWKRETGEIQSYQHRHQGAAWLHLDSGGQFYNRHAEPITRDVALAQNGIRNETALSVTPSNPKTTSNDQGISL